MVDILGSIGLISPTPGRHLRAIIRCARRHCCGDSGRILRLSVTAICRIGVGHGPDFAPDGLILVNICMWIYNYNMLQ